METLFIIVVGLLIFDIVSDKLEKPVHTLKTFLHEKAVLLYRKHNFFRRWRFWKTAEIN